jgi:hypothetical protein
MKDNTQHVGDDSHHWKKKKAGTDPQAEAMKEAIDPHQTLSTLEQLLKQAEEQVRKET